MTHFLNKVILGTSVLVSFSATQAFADETLTIENFIGTINVQTAGGDTLRVTESRNDKSLDVSARSGSMKIDGNIDKPNGDDCEGYYGRYNISVFSKKEKSGQFGGYKDLESYPVLTISAPDDLNLIIKNSIPFITLGDMGSLDASLKSCGELNTGNLSGNARLSIKGSADANFGDIQDLDLMIKGSGDVDAGNAGNIKIDLTGSGDVELGDIKSADIRSVGSGDVEIRDMSGPLRYISRGSGDFDANDVSGDLVYNGRGSGDFSVKSVTGNMSIQSRGSSRVEIDGGTVQKLIITAAGSGDVRFEGTAENAELFASGSSDIYVERVTGQVSKRETGSAEVKISNR